MNREIFLKRLEKGLSNVTADERVAAMQYYTEYFDDAGPEREAELIQELGDPDIVAAGICATSATETGENWVPPVKELSTEETEETVTENGETPAKTLPPPQAIAVTNSTGNAVPPPQAPNPPGSTQTPPYNESQGHYPANVPAQQNYRPRNTGNLILIILLLIFASPILLGVGGLLLGLFITLVVLLTLPVILGGGFVIASIAAVIAAVILMPLTFANGLLTLGGALMLFAGGILLCMFGSGLLKRIVPAVFRSISSLFNKLFRRNAVST